MGCGLRRLAARTCVRRLRAALLKRVGAAQFGVAQAHGVAMAHRALSVDMQLLKEDATSVEDIENAHNAFCRKTARWAVERDTELQDMLPFLDLVMGDEAAELFYYGSDGKLRRTFEMWHGGHQGCALTSAVFPLVLALALALMPCTP